MIADQANDRAPAANGTGLTAVNLDRLLRELTALPKQTRADRLRAHPPGQIDDLLLALGDEAERLTVAALNRAVVASEALVAVADETGGPRARARARRAAAQALAYAGRFPEALERCAEAIAIASAGAQPVEGARARLASLHALASLGRFDEALAAGETARLAFLAAGEAALAARADLNLGAVHAMREQPRRALVHLDRARPNLAGDPAALATLETNRGNALTALDDFAGAEAAFAAAVAAFEAGGQRLAAAIAEGNLAYLATRQGRLPAALFHFERARRLLEHEPAPAHLARLQAEQAHALTTLGLPVDALATFERVLPELDAHGMAVEAAQARATLGGVLRRLGQHAEASTTLAEAEAAFGTLGQTVAQARVKLERAELLAAAGDPAARRLADEALAALAEHPAEAATTQALRARLALAAGDPDGAKRALDAALPPAERLALAPVLADLHLTRGRLHRAAGDDGRARASFRAAVAEVERVRGALQAERFRAAYLADRLAAYEELVVAALAADNDAGVAEAFAVVERAKGRSLLDALGGSFVPFCPTDAAAARRARADDPAEAALLDELARLRAELNWRYSRLADAGPGEARLDDADWGAALRVLDGELEAVQARLAAAQRPTGLFSPTVGLAEIRAALPPRAALLEYFTAGEEVLAFLVQPNGGEGACVRRHLGPRAEIAERLRRFRFQVGRALVERTGAADEDPPRAARLASDGRRALEALSRLVLAPLAPELEGIERLVVVPHGLLHAVPFHALPIGDDYLVERLEVAQIPSASLLARLTGPSTADDWDRRALVVGCPDELTPQIPAEVARVAAGLGGARTLLGPTATVERVAAEAAGAAVVHLACHGRFSADLPGASGLKLADRWLTIREASGLRLDGAHVTLSGCDTGRAHVTGGDELVGLSRALFAAGATSVLVSLWPVHDTGTAELMADFYARARACPAGRMPGQTRGAALRGAQLAALGRRPHPAFWAPFVLGGAPWS